MTQAEFTVDEQRLLEGVNALAAIGRTESGITRRAFSPTYVQAASWTADRMRAAGLTPRIDAVGNVIGRMGPPTGPVVMVGSHIDTVTDGGPLDGAYGVLAGIEVARSLQGHELGGPFEVVAFIDEEGAYCGSFGARCIAGTISDSDIEEAVDTEGTSLATAMAAAGFDAADHAEATYAPGSIGNYLELHIEQGPVLERERIDIGVVEGIAGLQVYDFCFRGKQGHAGTTPMTMRTDALRAAAAFVTDAYSYVDGLVSDTARATFGAVTVRPNMANVIPREATVRLDARDADEAALKAMCAHIADLARRGAETAGLEVEVVTVSENPPAAMATEMADLVESCADGLGYSYRRLYSGAGHDAQEMARVAPTGMIFVPSIDGLSHRGDEWSNPADLARGANVLLGAVARLTGVAG